jgi:hypothetical protein
MSNIQRFEPWPQEWPMEDNDGDLVMYDDHMKIVRGLEVKLANAVEALGKIARQKKTEQIEAEGETEFSDFEGAYDMCIDVARAMLAELEGKK